MAYNLESFRASLRGGSIAKTAAAGVAGAVLIVAVLMFVLDHEPEAFNVVERASARAVAAQHDVVVGYVATATLVEVLETLLDKRGGYLSNDVFPPGVLMDNVPAWEWGVLVQARDLAIALRNDMSRSQTQSVEDTDLIKVDNQLRIDHESWMFPAAETEYRGAAAALRGYLGRLNSAADADAQFFARADNLRAWLSIVQKRLGDLSQRLGASVGQARVNTDLAGDAGAEQSTVAPTVVIVKTPWYEIDDVFYEARGATWALIHFLRAMEHDFGAVLEKKNAIVSVRQIIRELESTQDPVWSPVVLNGKGFGFVANHSLVMASYISRANAAVIDLVVLLERG